MKALLMLAVFIALCSPAFAENIVFPTSPLSPVINVKTAFGAVGDGVADDTAAVSKTVTATAASS